MTTVTDTPLASLAEPEVGAATRTRFLIVAYDHIADRMAGPAARTWEIAQAMAQHADVTIASEQPVERLVPDGLELATFTGNAELRVLLQRADVVLVQGLAVRRYPCLRSAPGVVVVDLYDPWVFENLEMYRDLPSHEAEQLLQSDADVLNELVDVGDFFVCASERQRDYWLGVLTSRGRINRVICEWDRDLRTLIDVLPYGCPPEPAPGPPVLRGVHPDVAEDAFVVLWSGGMWPWFDPDTVLDAVALAAEREPRLKLYVMGAASQPGSAPSAFAAKVAEKVHSRPILQQHVVLGEWVPYDERYHYLAEADLAVIATKQSAETRLAFRSRVLDHLWAGLPTLTTPGCVLADLVTSEGAGWLVDYQDTHALANKLVELASDNPQREAASERARDLANTLRWTENVQSLVPVVTDPQAWIDMRAQRPKPWATIGVRYHFMQRGIVVESLKRTRLYPFMRWVRRTRLGLFAWGPVADLEQDVDATSVVV